MFSTPHDDASSLRLVETDLCLATDDVTPQHIVGTPSGDILYGGDDGNIYLLHFRPAASLSLVRRGPGADVARIRKINLSASILSKWVPASFRPVSRSHVKALVFDADRQVFVSLIEHTAPQAGHAPQDAALRRTSVHVWRLESHSTSARELAVLPDIFEAVRKVNPQVTRSAVQVCGLYVVPQDFSHRITLMVLTVSGVRVFFTYYRSSASVTSTKITIVRVAHVRLPPTVASTTVSEGLQQSLRGGETPGTPNGLRMSDLHASPRTGHARLSRNTTMRSSLNVAASPLSRLASSIPPAFSIQPPVRVHTGTFVATVAHPRFFTVAADARGDGTDCVHFFAADLTGGEQFGFGGGSVAAVRRVTERFWSSTVPGRVYDVQEMKSMNGSVDTVLVLCSDCLLVFNHTSPLETVRKTLKRQILQARTETSVGVGESMHPIATSSSGRPSTTLRSFSPGLTSSVAPLPVMPAASPFTLSLFLEAAAKSQSDPQLARRAGAIFLSQAGRAVGDYDDTGLDFVGGEIPAGATLGHVATLLYVSRLVGNVWAIPFVRVNWGYSNGNGQGGSGLGMFGKAKDKLVSTLGYLLPSSPVRRTSSTSAVDVATNLLAQLDDSHPFDAAADTTRLPAATAVFVHDTKRLSELCRDLNNLSVIIGGLYGHDAVMAAATMRPLAASTGAVPSSSSSQKVGLAILRLIKLCSETAYVLHVLSGVSRSVRVTREDARSLTSVTYADVVLNCGKDSGGSPSALKCLVSAFLKFTSASARGGFGGEFAGTLSKNCPLLFSSEDVFHLRAVSLLDAAVALFEEQRRLSGIVRLSGTTTWESQTMLMAQKATDMLIRGDVHYGGFVSELMQQFLRIGAYDQLVRLGLHVAQQIDPERLAEQMVTAAGLSVSGVQTEVEVEQRYADRIAIYEVMISGFSPVFTSNSSFDPTWQLEMRRRLGGLMADSDDDIFHYRLYEFFVNQQLFSVLVEHFSGNRQLETFLTSLFNSAIGTGGDRVDYLWRYYVACDRYVEAATILHELAYDRHNVFDLSQRFEYLSRAVANAEVGMSVSGGTSVATNAVLSIKLTQNDLLMWKDQLEVAQVQTKVMQLALVPASVVGHQLLSISDLYRACESAEDWAGALLCLHCGQYTDGQLIEVCWENYLSQLESGQDFGTILRPLTPLFPSQAFPLPLVVFLAARNVCTSHPQMAPNHIASDLLAGMVEIGLGGETALGAAEGALQRPFLLTAHPEVTPILTSLCLSVLLDRRAVESAEIDRRAVAGRIVAIIDKSNVNFDQDEERSLRQLASSRL